ncbi:WxcM-like domain-containing protein [Pengzhenrongella sicca]|uniref:WxcM-like domain-containing protein n=1 Tax=Pengzhenrongella sicca TaxID=2819238 RepID=A0A8A4ZFZ8_9MICO|nr:WxcM-like domain-containing protein [Pengzhenrongella sicca]QTE29863.1 WxcM-like domain-containing protein [Pengzhenrongella sicca]
MTSLVHPQALCESENVGSATTVRAFTHIHAGAVLGAGCDVGEHVLIEDDVVVGDRVTIMAGVQLWDGVRLGDDVFVGPNVTFTNAPMPRDPTGPPTPVRTVVAPGASLGAGAVLLPGVRVGRNAMVGAGAVVTRNVPANAVVVGNPARIHGYVNDSVPTVTESSPVLFEELVGGAKLIPVRMASDLRGSLSAVELRSDLPFPPARFFAVFGVPSKDVRGEHAHRRCAQVLICLRGSVTCIVDDGTHRNQLTLSSPDRGLFMPPMLWGTQYNYSTDTVLAVFASHAYDGADYIRDYDQFLNELADTDS